MNDKRKRKKEDPLISGLRRNPIDNVGSCTAVHCSVDFTCEEQGEKGRPVRTLKHRKDARRISFFLNVFHQFAMRELNGGLSLKRRIF